MPQSRDRRLTSVDLAAAFARNRAFFIYNDPPPHRTPPRTLPRGRARAFLGSENTPPSARRARGRVSSRSLLPAWYPRTPLRDITAVARAIERRRARLGEVEGQRTESIVSTADQVVLEPSETASASAASSSKSPKSVGVKLRTPLGCKVPKIYLDISELPEGESETLTPQKKLLNNIDQVQEAVLEELKKLKRTPSAKKAEREKRVRTLMSMR
ncbi:protein POLYCHOME [Vigna radiata var. radiata]|uniref:Protein POLYCHOME n=1 Tax=Vigna radiata var. radiata TaxID=3916 RepID=A0A1S3TNR2_VIGRR|nr:protein POLYCHOME [Vigna radiata var. radiata]